MKSSADHPSTATGTRPPGVQSQQEAAVWVRSMFADVAPRYDLLNHILSLNIDRLWRRRLLSRVRPLLAADNRAAVLDLCCGTGDSLLELQTACNGSVVGVDFCHPMLVEAQRKVRQQRAGSVLVEGDALCLPFRAESFRLIVLAFGFRNLADYRAALEELRRLLAPGGGVAILEFSHPPSPLWRLAYEFYLRTLLPGVGRAFSNSKQGYAYLADSIARFPAADQLAHQMTAAGFAEVEYDLLTGGVAALHLGRKR